ncbi:MAG: Branched-chain amino acid transporter, amino acid-binding protein [Labilithrix sp.]|nr:Branched-chain amino acid transporter, amino acid-binding protein [Labilithrix sp.]
MNLRSRLLALTLVAASGGLLASTLSTTTGCTKDADKPSAQPPIVIGVSLGLTKGLAAFAQPLREAVRTAEGQINANGGVLGRPLFFDVRDDESDEEKGIVEGIANDFVRQGAVAVIGPVGSQQVVKTQGIYAAAHILQISPSATSTDLSTIQPASDRWLYRTTPADDFQGAAVLLFAQRTPRGLVDGGAPAVDGGPPATCTKLAVVNVDNAYGNSMADVIEQNFPKRVGQPLVARQKVSVNLVDSYADVVAKLMPLQPECLALIAYDDVAVPFVRDFKADPRYAALEDKGFFFIGTDGVFTDGFLLNGRQNPSDPTSANVAEGVYGTNPDTQPGTKEYNEFRAQFSSFSPLGRKADNTPADAPAFAANTYDAAMLIALAIQRAGTADDREKIRTALLEVANPPGRPYTPAQIGDALIAVRNGDDVDYKGASGAVDLEANGNVKSGFIVWQAYRDTTKKVDYRTVGRFTLEELTAELK